MRYRCFNPKKHNFKYYGGRGIKVCKRWLDFANFVADMGDKPQGTTLDRINQDGDYEPSNCRWATKLQQANNARSNHKLLVDGETLGLCEAARKYNIRVETIWRRLKFGWGNEEAVKTPVDSRFWEGRRKKATNRAMDRIR